MGKVDSLSRRPDWKIGVKKDNENQQLIKKEWMRGMMEVVVERLETKLVEKIKKAREKDKEVVRVVEKMKKAEVKVLRGDKWQIEGELVLKERKVYILKNKELRMEIIQLYHDILEAEHRGR